MSDGEVDHVPMTWTDRTYLWLGTRDMPVTVGPINVDVMVTDVILVNSRRYGEQWACEVTAIDDHYMAEVTPL